MNHLKPHKSVEQIAKKHRLDVSFIAHQLAMGEPIEHEHTKDHKLAMDIALQHLDEIPDYYTRLKKMEASAKKEHKKFKDVKEETKSGDQGLRDWFGKSKSSSGKKGWVQLGGEFSGEPCARQPGQTSTPKCGSSKMKRDLNKDEEELAFKRKNRLDPNQPEKTGGSKPTNVRTEEMNLQEVKDKPGKDSGKKDACYTKVKSRYDVWPSAYASGALVKCRKVGAANWGTKSEAVNAAQQAAIAISMKKKGIKPEEMKEETGMVRYCPKCQKDETQSECKYGPKFWALYSSPSMLTTNQMKFDVAQVHPANEAYDHEHSMARSEISTIISAAKRLKKKIGKGEGNIEAWVQSKITKAADYIDAAADYVDSGEMNKESVNIEDANGNHYAEFIDIIEPQPLKASRGIGSQLVGEGALPSPIDPAAHKQAQKTQKLYNKGTSTDNSNEKEIFLKRTGPQLPLAKTATKKEVQVAHYKPSGLSINEEPGDGYIGPARLGIKNPLASDATRSASDKKRSAGQSKEGGLMGRLQQRADATDAAIKMLNQSYYPERKSFTRFMSEANKSEMKCNSPKAEPVGDSLTGKSHVVKACEGGKEKLIRFGQRGVKGSPKKKGESKEYASRRHRFQTRHAKNIAKGKMSAAYWANKVKW